jgi:hypothetical protein
MLLRNHKHYKIFFAFIFLLPYFLNFYNFEGNKFLFLVFQISSYLLFLVIIRKNTSAFEFFTYIFFLLSFWFKFNCILFFESIIVTESDFDLNISNYDNAVYIIIITFISCISASFIKEFIIKIPSKKKQIKINNSFKIFYKSYRIFIISAFIGFLIIIYLTNQYFEIYFKGLINDQAPSIIRYIYSYLMVYGLAVVTSVLLYVDFLIYKNSKIFLLGIFEAFFTQLNILSRTFILSIIVYLRGFLLLFDIKKINYSNSFYIKAIFLFLIFVFVSIYSVNKFRNVKHYSDDKNKPNITIVQTFSEIMKLSINRWVGIDALLSVSQSKNINLEFFFLAWKEKVDNKKLPFYSENFNSKYHAHNDSAKSSAIYVVTPGIVAFLYYSGSVIFVFFSILILILFCLIIERLFYYFSCKNVILTNIIGYALAVRVVHFGYVPSNILNFFLSIIFSLIFIITITNLLKKA